MPRSGIDGTYSSFIFSVERISILFSLVVIPIFIPTNNIGGFPFPSPALIVCRLFKKLKYSWFVVSCRSLLYNRMSQLYSYMNLLFFLIFFLCYGFYQEIIVLICISLLINSWASFHVPVGISISSLEKCLFSFAQFLIGFCLLLLSCISCLYALKINLIVCKYFLPFCGLYLYG